MDKLKMLANLKSNYGFLYLNNHGKNFAELLSTAKELESEGKVKIVPPEKDRENYTIIFKG